VIHSHADTDEARTADRAGAAALSGVRILDLSRILAGPVCTQLLGDLGADVIKVERPRTGDDTRHWGPPFVKDLADEEAMSAYFLSANRNKRSIAVDVVQPAGQAVLRQLLSVSDVLIENFKVGGLSKWGLGYDQLCDEHPRLVYCSISGFGQTGPYAHRTGYDLLAQAMGGIMSLTGEPDGEPQKVGVGVADVMAGMYAAVAILAALRSRDRAGAGQHIDLSLLDTQVAWLANAGQGFLTSAALPARLGNAHPNIVPYQVFATSDGHIVVAVGNDAQFRRLCEFAGAARLADDPSYAANPARVRNRDELTRRLGALVRQRPSSVWLEGLERLRIPCGAVNDLEQVFADPQVLHRDMRIAMDDPTTPEGEVRLIGNPIKMSATPVTYRLAPPRLGQHTDEVLASLARMNPMRLAQLRDQGAIA